MPRKRPPPAARRLDALEAHVAELCRLVADLPPQPGDFNERALDLLRQVGRIDDPSATDPAGVAA